MSRAPRLPVKKRPATCEIPIIDRGRRIVGWTFFAPQFRGPSVPHPEAQGLIGDDVVCAYVQIDEPILARRAGAPVNWQGSWRCLGLCSVAAVARLYQGGDAASPVIICT